MQLNITTSKRDKGLLLRQASAAPLTRRTSDYLDSDPESGPEKIREYLMRFYWIVGMRNNTSIMPDWHGVDKNLVLFEALYVVKRMTVYVDWLLANTKEKLRCVLYIGGMYIM